MAYELASDKLERLLERLTELEEAEETGEDAMESNTDDMRGVVDTDEVESPF